ncbi:MAG: hypothetical protein ABSB23_18320 [Bryobacteraceae bacterium]|jgi:hypothetical protein
MNTIVIPEDDLQRLERRFGPDVRRMGPWNSDGVFGYTSISLGTVESAAEAVGRPGLPEAVSQLKEAREPVAAFLQLVETFGPDLVVKIKAAYSALSLLPPSGRPAGSAKLAASRASGAASAA